MAWSTLIKAGVALGATAISSDKIASALEKSADKLTQAGVALQEGEGENEGGSHKAKLPFSTNRQTSTTAKCIGCHAPLAGRTGTTYQCPYCDTVQTLG